MTNVSTKLLSESKQQRLQTRTTAHIQRKLAEVWAEYQAMTRSVDGVLRACSRIYYIMRSVDDYGVADIVVPHATLMVAFQDGTIHDVTTKVWDYNKTADGDVPRPQPQAVTEHMMQLGEQMSTGNL